MQTKLTIYDIKRLTQETEPHFFARDTMKFFNQRLKDFKVYKLENGKYLIKCSSFWDNKLMGYTERVFNPETNKLEFRQDT